MKSDVRSNRKLTVAHFIASTVMGGVEIATLRLTAATREKFHHVAFCLPDAVELRNLFENQAIETITYQLPAPSLRHGIRFYKESRILADQLNRVGADIVHFSDKFAAYYSSFAALLAHTRIACHVRLSHPTLSLRDRLTLMPVQSFIFVSREAMQTFALSLPEHRKRVIYDTIEVSTTDMTESNAAVRCEFAIPPACPLVGIVARVAQQKDFFTLADAAAKVVASFPDTRFFVVGEHSSTESLRIHFNEVTQRLHELGITDNFIFTGYRKDVARLVAAMDIFVLCTHREGFPLSILEAMAMSKPVIATAVGGVPEIVQHGVTGYLHQHGDSNELAAEIIALIENPEEAHRVGTAGYELIRENYSCQKYTEEIVKAYTDLMNR